MVHLARRLPETGLKAKMVLQVHDELLFEVGEQDAKALAEFVRTEMEGAATLDVALEVETGIGPSWADAH